MRPTPLLRASVQAVTLIALVAGQAAVAVGQGAAEGRPVDPRSLILDVADVSGIVGAIDRPSIAQADTMWLPCDVTVESRGPVMLASTREPAWVIRQGAVAFETEATAATALAAVRGSLSGPSSACSGPEDVLAVSVSGEIEADLELGEDVAGVTGTALIDSDDGRGEHPMELYVIRHGPSLTSLMVVASGPSSDAVIRDVASGLLQRLAVRASEAMALPSPDRAAEWRIASDTTADAAADAIEAFTDTFETSGPRTKATLRASRRLRRAIDEHRAWLKRNRLPLVSASDRDYLAALRSATRRAASCPTPSRCLEIVASEWGPATEIGIAAAWLRDLASTPFDIATSAAIGSAQGTP